jgi:hypothetical protein
LTAFEFDAAADDDDVPPIPPDRAIRTQFDIRDGISNNSNATVAPPLFSSALSPPFPPPDAANKSFECLFNQNEHLHRALAQVLQDKFKKQDERKLELEEKIDVLEKISKKDFRIIQEKL